MQDRKLKILGLVVDEYVRTGEPVGSKAIVELLDISVSSATVRNDMAALEKLGYLEQPYTSAGRIPTYAGFRLYLDELMCPNTLPIEERARLDAMLGDPEQLTEEFLLQSASTALAEISRCATVTQNAVPKFSVISKVEVIPTGKRLYVILLITSQGNIKNRACRLEFDLSHEQLDFFTQYLEENLQGISIEQLSEERMNALIAAMGTYMMSLSPLLQGLYELSKDMVQSELKVTGAKNLLTCEELDKMDVVQFLENQESMLPLLDDAFSGIQVVLSEENDRFVIGNSSMIVARYGKDHQKVGSLGVIGPMRLNYKKIIPYIEYFTEKLDALVAEDFETEKGGRPDGK